MKVKLNLKNPKIKRYKDLTPDKIYRVIGIEADDFRIMNDEERPYLYPPDLFLVVNSHEPDEWVTEYGEDGERYSYPKELNRIGFFEDYFEGDKETISAFDCRQMVERIQEETEDFPQEHRPSCGYWSMHLPVTQGFIDGLYTPNSVRHICVQTLIDRAYHLYSLKPIERERRVMTAVTLPNLFDAQIVVFFGSEYFDTFFDRHSSEQQWTRLPDDRSLIEEWDLSIPSPFIERGYREIIQDEDFSHEGEIWFMGELGEAK